MSEPLLTIGAFARAVGLTTSALRHYDECGLLPPAAVDDLTGYRYYTPELADRARLVGSMREVGMPIAGMREVLYGTPEQAQQAVRDFLDEQSARSARSAAVLDDVLSQLAAAAAPPTRVVVRGPELASALRQVRSATDVDPASPLSSVLLDLADGGLDVVATNRYWMAVRSIAVDAPASEARVVLPRSAVDSLAAQLDGTATATLTFSAQRLDVDGRPHDGRGDPYPAHRLVLAGLEEASTHAVLPRDELVAALDATGRAQARVTLGADGACVDDHHVAATVTGEGVAITLGTALLRRGLAATLGPEVEWALSSPVRPVRLTSPYQSGFQALLMPIADD